MGQSNSTAWGISDASHALQVYKVADFAYETGDNIIPARQPQRGPVDGVLAKREDSLQRGSLFACCTRCANLVPQPTAGTRTLRQMIIKESLDVAIHAAAHGRVATSDEFMKIFGSGTQ